jgi:hypothetical protein
MLSEKIKALRESLQRYSTTPVTLEPKAMVSICVMLMSFEHEAAALEAGIAVRVPETAMDLPDNVVQLFRSIEPSIGGVA